MDLRLTWTDCDEAGDYVVPNVLSPRDQVSRPDNIDETVLHMKMFNVGGNNHVFQLPPFNSHAQKADFFINASTKCFFITKTCPWMQYTAILQGCKNVTPQFHYIKVGCKRV